MIRRAALLAALAAVVLQGCDYLAPTPSPAIETPLPDFTTSVSTPEGVAGVVVSPTFIRLVFVSGGGGSGSEIQGPAPHIYLLSMDGQTGQTYNSWVYGIAPDGATSVELAGAVDALSAPMVDGVFLIVLKAKGVEPNALHWTFKSADGAVVAKGDGLRP